MHDCLQQTRLLEGDLKFNTLTINLETMNDKIDKLDVKFDGAMLGISEIKDMITVMRINNQKEKLDAINEVKEWASGKFAGKLVEKIVYITCGSILLAVLGALTTLVLTHSS